MQRKDLLELKRRFKKEECTISRMAGCYVNAQKEKVVTLNEMFPNLPDEEFFKYLEIAKKTLSGTLGNNLLELSFTPPTAEDAPGENTTDSDSPALTGGTATKQQFFRGLISTELKQGELLDRFYDIVIENYDYTGNYLILVYYDAMDVIVKTEDGRKLDESEEVYTYMICSLCPVTLSKPGLGYLEEENKIGVRLRDWIVGMPENGFLYPAFSDRSSDIDSLMFYTKNAKEPHPAFMENGLGCCAKRTGTQQKKAFENVIKKAVAGTDVESDELFLTIQESLCDMVDRQELENPKDPQPIELTPETFQEIITDCELGEYIAPKIKAAFDEEFADGVPTADAVLDVKLLAQNEQKKKEKELVCEVASLKKALSQAQTGNPDDTIDNNDKSGDAMSESATDDTITDAGMMGETLTSDMTDSDFMAGNTPTDNMADDDFIADDATMNDTADANISASAQGVNSSELQCDVFLRVKPDRANLITSQIVNGKKCLVIPVEDGDDIDINGVRLD